jgi:NRPS condensation-like uncharacterized protein
LSDIPKRFPATGTDSAVAITRAVTKHRIGLRLAFESGSLDPERLARAVRLSMDAQPILGCSFRTDESKAYWLRLPALDEASVFSVVQTADPDGAMDSFQADEIADEGPQAKAVLLRASGADHLGIKVSHVLADGQAAKQYAYLLADIYSRLGADPGYTPRPDLGHRPTGRDVWDRLSAEQRREARKAKSWANPTWVMPAKGESGRGLTYRAASLGPEAFSAVKAHGRLREATVNDMMLAAVFRACVEQFDPPVGTPLSLMCTADLRRYLPDPEHLPISNISISGSLDIERVDGESFDGTLRRVRERMVVWSKTCYGAAPAASAERLAGLGYRVTKALLSLTFRTAGRSGKTYPWFTNIGIIDESRLSFDGHVPSSGHMYGPAAMGASIVPVVSTYRDTLTVCMGFCEQDCDVSLVDGVLQSVLDELEGALEPHSLRT